jgi:AraC family transcriptional regulator
MSARQLANALSVDETRLQLRDRPLRATSANQNWGGVAVDEYGAKLIEERVTMPPRDHHVVTVSQGYSGCVYQSRLGKEHYLPSQPGNSITIPAGYENSWCGMLPAHVRFALSFDCLREGAEELRRLGTPAGVDLANVFQVRDPTLAKFAELFSLELGRPAHPAQQTLVEALTVALKTHILRGYMPGLQLLEAEPAAKPAAVQRAIDYIQQSPHDVITLSRLASVSGLSRFHLVRVFQKHVGVSPMQYLERTRIERAQWLICQAELSLAQIALAVGYSDQSHFTRRFKSHVGQTPASYAREFARGRLPPRA